MPTPMGIERLAEPYANGKMQHLPQLTLLQQMAEPANAGLIQRSSSAQIYPH